MARKYLNDIGVGDNPMILDPQDSRWEHWKKEIEEFGFPCYETWALDLFFYAWLYERLKMYLEVNCVDLTFHKFEFEGNVYTQAELIDKMIYGCELVLLQDRTCKRLTTEEEKAIDDVRWIWATVMPAMWW
jgi:hypothetical protein